MGDDILTFEELRSVQNSERNSDTLQPLDEDFFERARNYLGTKKGGDDHLQNQEYRNAKNILQDVLDMRQKKIVKLAFLSVKSNVNVENLLSHEQELFQEVEETIGAYRHDRHEEVFEGRETVDGSVGEQAATEEQEVEETEEEGEEADEGEEAEEEREEEDAGEPDEAEVPVADEDTADEDGEDAVEEESGEEEDGEEQDVAVVEDNLEEASEETEPEEEKEKVEQESGEEEEEDDSSGSSVDDILQFDKDEDEDDAEETEEEEQEDGKVEDTEEGEAGDDRVTVRMQENVTEFMGTDLNAYGPFEEGEEAEIPPENADVLEQQGKAERV